MMQQLYNCEVVKQYPSIATTVLKTAISAQSTCKGSLILPLHDQLPNKSWPIFGTLLKDNQGSSLPHLFVKLPSHLDILQLIISPC